MKIPSQAYISHNAHVGRSSQTDGGKPPSSSGSGADAVAEGDVKVTVSAEAKQLAEAGAIDTAKVERLRAAIDDGSFQIDPQRIAQRIVDQE